MAPHGTIIGQIQTTAPAQHTATVTATPTGLPQVSASPTQIQHLQAAPPQAIISQPQQVSLPPTAISPPKEAESNQSVAVADSQNVPVAVESQKEETPGGECKANFIFH